MPKPKDLVSIIIPCYNCSQSIIAILDTIKNQSHQDWECILINDGSTDKTEENIKQYIVKDSRFKYYKQNNLGASSARNFGIEVSKGNYIYFADADDLLQPNTLSSLLNLANNEIDIVIGKAVETQGQNTKCTRIIENSVEELKNFNNKNKHLIMLIVEHLVSCVAWNKLYRASFLKTKKITFKSGIIHEDELWFFETFFYAKGIIFNDEITYFYNIGNDDSISNNLDSKSVDSYLAIIKTIYEDYYLNRKYSEFKDIISTHITNMKIRFFKYNYDNLDNATKITTANKIENTFNEIKPWKNKFIFSEELERNHIFFRKIQNLKPEEISLALYLYPYSRIKRKLKKNLLVLKARKKRFSKR